LATCNKSGTFPPRAFRKVAILLIFTLNFVIRILVEILNVFVQDKNTKLNKAICAKI